MADLVYELLSQVMKNTSITINFTPKPTTGADEPKNEPKNEEPQPPQESGLVRADLVQLISDLERVSATLKKIDRRLVGNEHTDVFFMLQNFDKILASVKMVVNAV